MSSGLLVAPNTPTNRFPGGYHLTGDSFRSNLERLQERQPPGSVPPPTPPIPHLYLASRYGTLSLFMRGVGGGFEGSQQKPAIAALCDPEFLKDTSPRRLAQLVTDKVRVYVTSHTNGIRLAVNA